MSTVIIGKENEKVAENIIPSSSIKSKAQPQAKPERITVILDRNSSKETKVLDFGEIPVGSQSSKTYEIKFENPSNSKVKLSLEAFPGYNRTTHQPSLTSSFSSKVPMHISRSKLTYGFGLRTDSLLIEPLNHSIFEIKWMPTQAKSLSESFQIKNVSQRYNFTLVAKGTEKSGSKASKQKRDTISLNETTEISLDHSSLSIDSACNKSSFNDEELSFNYDLNQSAIEEEEDEFDLSTINFKGLAPPSSQNPRQSLANTVATVNPSSSRKSIISREASTTTANKANKVASTRMVNVKTYKMSPSKQTSAPFRRPSIAPPTSQSTLARVSSLTLKKPADNAIYRKAKKVAQEDAKDQHTKVKQPQGTVSAHTINKKEDGLVQWINFVIDPINQSSSYATGKVVQKNVENILAEHKTVIKKLNYTCCTKQLSMRLDRDLYSDIGVRQNIINLIIHSYQAKWLIAALEGIYKCTINISSANTPLDVNLILSNFIAKRVLHNPEVAESEVKDEAIEEELNAFRLRQILLIFWLLDRMTERKVFGPKDKCLFNKNSVIKSSLDMLHTFVGEYIIMEFQNFVKILNSFGYELTQVQTYLDEYEFTVSNPMDQFQDGIRLMKIAETVTNEIRSNQRKEPLSLVKKLKIPPTSYSHCLSNLNLALAEFESLFGKGFSKTIGGINANHFFNGNTEKIYSFIWQLFLHWKLPELLDTSILESEIRKLKVIFQIPAKSISTMLYFDSKPIQLLLKWCKVIGYQFQKEVQNFTSSFADGTSFCYLIHYYLPNLLEANLISVPPKEMSLPQEKTEEEQSNWTGSFSPTNLALKHQKDVYRAIKSNFRCLLNRIERFIDVPFAVYSLQNLMNTRNPDEKTTIIFLSHLFRKLIIAHQEENAAIFLQRAWKQYLIRKERLRRNRAATKIQIEVRNFLFRLHEKKRINATKIQSWLRYVTQRNNFTATRRQICLLQQFVKMRVEQTRLAKKKEYVQTIQNLVRLYSPRKDFLTKVNATKQIQSLIRFVGDRSQFLYARQQVHVLQQFTRTVQSRLYFLKARSSCEIVQSFSRMNTARQEFLDTRNKVVFIQSLTRMMKCREHFHMMKSKIETMQAFIRSTNDRKRFQLKKKLALFIQASFLAKQARDEMQRRIEVNAATTIQNWIRFSNERRNYLQVQSSTKTIQKFTKFFEERKKYKEIYSANLQIQSFHRMNEAKKYFELCRNSSRLAQRFVRYSQQRLAYLDTRQKVKLIQSLIRFSQERSLYKLQRRSSITIESFYRMKEARTYFLQHRRATCILQSFIRSTNDRRDFLTQRNSSLQIQAFVRSMIARQKFLDDRSKVITIQSFYRTYLDRAQFKLLRETALQLQAYLRATNERRDYQLRKKKSIMIQSFYRSALAQRDFLLHRRSIQLIENFIRSANERRLYLSNYKKCEQLQSFIRMDLGRSHFLDRRSKCIDLQSFIRLFRARKNFKIAQEANLQNQRTIRMYQTRKSFNLQKSSAKLIENFTRFMIGRFDFLRTREKIIQLQSFIRFSQIRRKYLEDYSKVVNIQSLIRLDQSRKVFLTKRSAAITLQSFERFNKNRSLFNLKKKSAIEIETFTRFNQARCNFLLKKRSSVLIQSQIRSMIERMSFLYTKKQTKLIQTFTRFIQARANFLKNRKAAIQVQSLVRFANDRGSFLNHKFAAISIQSFSRFIEQRKQFLLVKNSTKIIENLIRMRSAMMELNRRKKTVIIQNWIRFTNDRSKYLQRRSEVRKSSLLIQSQFRMSEIRKDFLHQKKTSTIISSFWRLVLSRKYFLESLAASKKIQSFERMNLSRSHFKVSQKSNKIIQSFIKFSQERKEFLRLKENTKVIQSMFKMLIARKKYQRDLAAKRILTSHLCLKQRKQFLLLNQSSTFIQSFLRTSIERNQFKLQRSSLIFIQSFIRSIIERKKQIYIQKQVKTIQSFIRFSQAKRLILEKVKERKESALRIFQWYKQRKLVQKTHFNWFKNSFITLQRTWRYKKAIKVKAATTIQSLIRLQKVSKQIQLENSTATKIQAIWRGALARKHRTQEIIDITNRIRSANQRATEALKLSNRTKSALEALKGSKNLSDPMLACEALDVATRLSIRCCNLINELNGVSIVISLIQTCNRSLPHQQILSKSLNILFNMSVASSQLSLNIYHTPLLLQTVVLMMANYIKESPEIFIRACNLLTALCNEEVNARSFAGSGCYGKVSGMLPALQKRAKAPVDAKSSKQKVPLEKMTKALQNLLKRTSCK